MKLRVLGCHGGELPNHRTSCFLIDGTLALDAGALTSQLSLEELSQVEHVLLSHAHFDHCKDLPLLADLLVGRRDRPVVIHAAPQCARTLRENLFNDLIWPDFTAIPSREQPVLRIDPFEPGRPFTVDRYRVTPIAVNHPVESCGFVISDGRVALGYSGDTGPTEALWRTFAATPELRAALVETSFPSAMQELADLSGHLTPRTFALELAKARLPASCRLFHYHLKPAFIAQLREELDALCLGSRVLELDERIEL